MRLITGLVAGLLLAGGVAFAAEGHGGSRPAGTQLTVTSTESASSTSSEETSRSTRGESSETSKSAETGESSESTETADSATAAHPGSTKSGSSQGNSSAAHNCPHVRPRRARRLCQCGGAGEALGRLSERTSRPGSARSLGSSSARGPDSSSSPRAVRMAPSAR